MVRFAPLALFALFAHVGLTSQASSAGTAMLDRGQKIADRNCGTCHATGRTGASPNPKSPPFRDLSRRYPLSHLEEALGEGIVVGHEGLDMPQFRFDAGQVEALLAYLGSIQKR